MSRRVAARLLLEAGSERERRRQVGTRGRAEIFLVGRRVSTEYPRRVAAAPPRPRLLRIPTSERSQVLYFKGGGWCTNISDCASRSQGLLGSSAQLQAQQPKFGYGGSGPLGDDPELNPFARYNRVLLWYCDGASFSGDRDGSASSLLFRGKRNLDALLRRDARADVLRGGGRGDAAGRGGFPRRRRRREAGRSPRSRRTPRGGGIPASAATPRGVAIRVVAATPRGASRGRGAGVERGDPFFQNVVARGRPAAASSPRGPTQAF